MKKHFKKRLAAFKVGLVLSIVITPFCFYKLAVPVAAATNVITSNNYGSVTRTNIPVLSGSNGYYAAGMSVVDCQLYGIYNGQVDIYYTITGGLSIADYAVTAENCVIMSYSSSSMHIAFNNTQNWSVTFIRTISSGQGASSLFDNLTITALSNWNCTYVAQGEAAQNATLIAQTDQLENLVSTCNGSIIRCENLLTTIANNGTGGGSSVVTNIDANVDLAVDDLNLLKTSNDSILSTLLGFLTDSLGQVITLDSLLTAIESTTTELQTVNTHLTTLETSINSILTAINNIDNQIDTISWKNISAWTFNGAKVSDSDNSYNQGTIASNQGVTFNVDTTSSTDSNRNNRGIYHVRIPYRIYLNAQNIGKYDKIYVNVQNGSTIQNAIFWSFSGQYFDVYYEYDSYQQTRQMYIIIKMSVPGQITFYLGSGSSFIAEYIDQSDIEYWQLLQVFNQFEYNKKILNALNNLSININGDIVNQTENVINNYDTDFTTINNIESSFTTNFDNTNPSVISLFNSNLQIPQGFVDGSTFVKTLFPKVVDTNGLVGFPYFLILAIVVLIVILG